MRLKLLPVRGVRVWLNTDHVPSVEEREHEIFVWTIEGGDPHELPFTTDDERTEILRVLGVDSLELELPEAPGA